MPDHRSHQDFVLRCHTETYSKYCGAHGSDLLVNIILKLNLLLIPPPYSCFICSRHRKRSDPPSRHPPGRPSDGHCAVHPSHGPPSDSGSPVLGHYGPRDLMRSRAHGGHMGHGPQDSPERRRRTGHGSLTNISRHESLRKMESPPIRRSTSSGQYTGFSTDSHTHSHHPKSLDPESIAQVRRHTQTHLQN